MPGHPGVSPGDGLSVSDTGLLLWLDSINAVVEFTILMPFALDVRALYRARDSRAISLAAQWQYGAYCTYGAMFFGALEQWLSCFSSVVWIAAYAVKISLVVRYRPT